MVVSNWIGGGQVGWHFFDSHTPQKSRKADRKVGRSDGWGVGGNPYGQPDHKNAVF